MRSVMCSEFGPPSALRLAEASPPPMGVRDVRIRVRAAGIGFHDILMVAGKYQRKPPFPFAPGSDVAGEVIELGAEVNDLAIGQRVAALLTHGGFSEQVVAPRGAVAPLPDAVPFDVAAGLIMPYGTAYQGLVARAGLLTGETLLVRGAAGGVGLAAVQIGAWRGARVIAAAGGESKLALCRAAGASDLIDSRSADVRDRVRALTGGAGADVILDPVGDPGFRPACLSSVARNGRILVVGFVGGAIPEIPAHYLINKYCAVLGVAFSGEAALIDPAAVQRILTVIVTGCAEGALTPHIGARAAPHEVPEAMQAMIERRSMGRAVLVFD